MKQKALLPLFTLSLFAATPAAAAEEGGGGILTPEGGLMFWTFVVFLLVLGGLYKFAFPLILGAVEARERKIHELLAAAARDRDEAREILERQQKAHEELRTQAQQIFADAKAAGERLREEILAEARREQDAILERARREIVSERENMLDLVRRDAVEVAIAAAEKLVQRNLDGEQNRRLVRDFLGEVERGAPSLAAGV